MSDTSQVNTSCDLRGIREAVCVHTDKITDSCLAKDCIEDLRVYLTLDSQRALDAASGARARYVELMHVSIQVEPVPYNTGDYTVDITYYYRVLGETSSTGSCPNTITGLAVFSKRLVLFGGEKKAKTFLSRECGCLSKQTIVNCACPTGVVEVVDPIILGSCVQDACSCCCNTEPPARFRSQSSPASIRSWCSRANASACMSRSVSSPSRAFSAGRSCSSDLRLLHPHQAVPEFRRFRRGKPVRRLWPD
ncbi:MAG: hypothetical protein V8S92_02570 [Oscillospiraceae bacterium]